MQSEIIDLAKLKRAALVRFVFGFLFLGIILFTTAGTIRYWQAWLYLAVHFSSVALFLIYLIRKDPELLRPRMMAREREKIQKAVMLAVIPLYVALFIIPGLDRRYGWSIVPAWITITAVLTALSGYGLFVRVLLENRFAHRIVMIEKEQKLITTGPYAVVRHPMYSGAILTFVAAPVALGSFWGLIAIPGIIVSLLVRIHNEEKVLSRGLAGYDAYRRNVRWRIIPGIW
jgi:protein-S-isoprenylcysteine O-methyltransferase Ste14